MFVNMIFKKEKKTIVFLDKITKTNLTRNIYTTLLLLFRKEYRFQ